jgi:hypothetical protein
MRELMLFSPIVIGGAVLALAQVTFRFQASLRRKHQHRELALHRLNLTDVRTETN